MKSKFLREKKKKKVLITPAQQMLNRFEALQKTASAAAVKHSSNVVDDSSVARKQSVSNITAACNSSKVTCGMKSKTGDRVAHKPTLVRSCHVNCC